MTPKQIRIERLRQLQHERGLKGPVELGKLIGRKTNQTSDLLHGRAAFGEKVARSIEAVAGLPGGWLDQMSGSTAAGARGRSNTPHVAFSRRGIGVDPHQGRSAAPSGSADTGAPTTATGAALAGASILEVSRLQAAATSAPPTPSATSLVEPLHVSPAWAQQLGASDAGAHLRFMQVADDAMEPSIGAEDVLLVDTGVRECSRDGVYALRANGRDYVRRVRLRLDGQYEISADNPAIKSVDVVRMHQVRVLGQVLWGWRGHRF